MIYNIIDVKDMPDYFGQVISKVNNLEGTFVELGFGEGRSADFIVWAMNEGLLTKRDIWLYDSFEGFPEPTIEDKSPRNAQKGQWKVPIEPALAIKDKISTNVEVVKGYVEDTLPDSYKGGPIAVLHIDLDLYSAYKITLESLYDKVIEGGLILFDEYKSPPQYKNFPGASKAIDNFLIERDLTPQFYMGRFPNPDTQKYFIFKP